MPPAAIWVTIRYRPAIKLPGAVINTSSTAHIETSSTIKCADGRRTLGRSHRAGARNMPPRHPVAPWDSILADRPHPTTPDHTRPQPTSRIEGQSWKTSATPSGSSLELRLHRLPDGVR